MLSLNERLSSWQLQLFMQILPIIRPPLCYKDVCKRHMKACYTDGHMGDQCRKQNPVETASITRLERGESAMMPCVMPSRIRGPEGQQSSKTNTQVTESQNALDFTCHCCNRMCKSRIGLYSHTGGCFTANSPIACRKRYVTISWILMSLWERPCSQVT